MAGTAAAPGIFSQWLKAPTAHTYLIVHVAVMRFGMYCECTM